eukprot:3455104-Pyramimonas_sp.AAC.1
MPRTGGVATLVPNDPRVRSKGKSFVAGRVLLVTIHNSEVDFTIYHWNVHNFALDPASLKEIQACIRSQLQRVRDHPLKCTVVLTGDFNISATPIDHHRGDAHTCTPSSSGRGGQDSALQSHHPTTTCSPRSA